MVEETQWVNFTVQMPRNNNRMIKIHPNWNNLDNQKLNIQEKEVLTNDLIELWKSREMSDVAFYCSDGEPIIAHKLILSLRSPVFRAMFQSGMSEAITDKVKIEDMSSKAFKTLLEYIYTGCASFTSTDEIINIIPAADKYQLDKLKSSAFQLLLENMNANNVGDLVVIAHTYNALDETKLNIQEYLHTNRAVLMNSLAFHSLTERYPAAFSAITYGQFTLAQSSVRNGWEILPTRPVNNDTFYSSQDISGFRTLDPFMSGRIARNRHSNF